MSARHKCHTCGTNYNCNERWCPGCGKRLGHSDQRGDDTFATVEYDGRDKFMYRCDHCGRVTLDVFDPSFCGTCGARFVELKPSAEVVEREQRLAEVAKEIGASYVRRY